jgi:hypothetical protein
VGVVKNETDTQIRVSKDAGRGVFTVACKKIRDGATFEDFHFSLLPVGESIVIVQCEAPPKEEGEDKPADLIRQIVADNPKVTQKEIIEMTGLPQPTVFR